MSGASLTPGRPGAAAAHTSLPQALSQLGGTLADRVLELRSVRAWQHHINCAHRALDRLL